MEEVVKSARADLHALQDGGVDAIMFSNEASIPYLTTVDAVTTASKARVIGELLHEIHVPYGVNVLWDSVASLDLAAATGAQFVREIFTGVYASDFGLWNTNSGRPIRHQHKIGAQDVRLLFNIVPESAEYLADGNIADIAHPTVFNTRPVVLCVSDLTAGVETSAQTLTAVKEAVPVTRVFVNIGVRLPNLEEQSNIADGVVVGTTFKQEGMIWDPAEEDRVRAFMDRVRELRG